jgi:hypothetical protein
VLLVLVYATAPNSANTAEHHTNYCRTDALAFERQVLEHLGWREKAETFTIKEGKNGKIELEKIAETRTLISKKEKVSEYSHVSTENTT